MISIRYPSGSRTKQSHDPPSRTWYGGRSGSMPCSASAASVAVEVVDADRDVAVAGPEVVRSAVVVQRQLELLVLAGEAEEVVRRLPLAVPDDVHVAAELEAERLVERAARARDR